MCLSCFISTYVVMDMMMFILTKILHGVCSFCSQLYSVSEECMLQNLWHPSFIYCKQNVYKYIFSLLKQHITTGRNLKIMFLIFFVCFKYYLYYMVHLLHKSLSPIFQNLEPHTSVFPDAAHSFSLVPYNGILTVLFLCSLFPISNEVTALGIKWPHTLRKIKQN